MKSVGICNKSQQEIMNQNLLENFYHSYFVYVNIRLYRYNVRVVNSNSVNNNNSGSQQHLQAFYPNIFDIYLNHDETHY